MKANKILLLVSSLGTLAVLGWAAVTEQFFSDWRKSQNQVRSKLPAVQASQFSVQLRQIVSPDLRRTDRCVSCHVGMAPGETGLEGDPIYGKHPDVVHDPANWGCTVCHSGQGRATTAADAHGNVPHWPEPMLPKKYLYAGCGNCHSHLSVPNSARVEAGRDLFEQLDCLACHKMEGRGGTLRPGGLGGQEGPDLTRVGATGGVAQWYEKHLERKKAAKEPAWATAFDAIKESDRRAIDEYLNSRMGAPGLLEAKALFHTLGCRGCHKVGGVGGDDGPDLTREGERDPGQLNFAHVDGERTLANWLKTHFRSPATLVPNSTMPEFGLSDEELDRLTFYMLSLRHGDFSEQFWPKDRMQAERFGKREFAQDGATLYGTFCAACHGSRGEGMRYPGISAFPAIGNPEFQRLVSDDFLREQIKRGRSGRRMPAWGAAEGGLWPEEIETLVAHLRELSGVSFEGDPKPARWAKGDPVEGNRLYASACAPCHGATGEGKEGPALKNAVFLSLATDSYIFETTRRGRSGTAMAGFGQSSTVRGALTDGEIESIVSFIRTWEEKK